MREQEPFYVVWCPQGGSPTVRHDSLHKAHEEAKRLARANRGREFIVLCAFTAYQCSDLMQTDYRMEVPF